MPETGDTSGYTWRYVIDIALRHKRTLIVANMVAVLAVVMSVPIPMLMPLLVDEVLLEQPAFIVTTIQQLFPTHWHGPVLYVLVVLLLTVFLRISSIVLNVWQTREFTLVAKEISYRMRRDLLRRLERVSMSEYETLGSGAVASRFVTDINDVDEFIGQSVSKLLIAVLSLVAVTIILLWMHWPLALFILFANPFVVYVTTVLGKKVKLLKARENRAFEVFQQSLTESLDAIQQIRAANREKRFISHVIDKALGVKTDSAAFFWKSDAANRASFGTLLVGFDIFRAVSMLMVVFSDLTIGQMLAVFAYLWFMMGPVQEVLNIQYAFFGAKAALARINELLDLRDEPSYPHRVNPFEAMTTVGISVSDVHFSYTPEKPVLNGVTLDIDPGEKVALVGASGGGKSTLVQVLIGLYIPQRGSLYFDGVPVTDIGLDVVRDNVATVLQHPAMLNDTIRANLTLGRPYSDTELWQALDIAQLKDVVAYMPDALETIIGRHGLRLSGGQQQRLAIARMALTDPKVLILDEATSALDNDTEYEVHKALGLHFRDRTTLIIAHRLSAVKQADRVYVFEDGHIIEQGSHAELIDADGLYRKLYGSAQQA